MQLFYNPFIDTPQFNLSQEESNHLVKVLRSSVGDKITVTNGKGKVIIASLIGVQGKLATLSFDEDISHKFPKKPLINLFVGPVKNPSRWSYLLEKATEIGVANIYPIQCRYGIKDKVNVKKAENVFISALKQCLRSHLPIMHPIQSFKTAVESLEGSGILAWVKEESQPIMPQNEVVNIFIGPEGGFSDEEVKFAEENDVRIVTLGQQRLRTETAAIVALSILNNG